MSERTGPSVPDADLDRLRREHPRWLVERRQFADGMRFDARQLADPEGVRLVTETAEQMERQMAQAEAGTWRP